MQSPSQDRAIVDIKSTLAKHAQVVKNILPAHALSGCDTVASYFGLGKGTVVKVLKAGYDLSAMGNMDAPFHRVIEQATAFISACCGIQNSSDMSHTRLLAWGKKNGKGHTSAPKLAALPPTKEAFLENVKRAHFQSALWRNIDGRIPTAWDPWHNYLISKLLNNCHILQHQGVLWVYCNAKCKSPGVVFWKI